MKAAWWWIDRWRTSEAYRDMTAEERGVYREFIDELWLHDGLLPEDEMALSRLAGGEKVFARVKKRVLSHFRKVPGGWRNDVHDEVQKDSEKRAERQKRYRNKQRNVTASPSPSPSKQNTGSEEPPMPLPPGVKDDTDIDILNAVWASKRGGVNRWITDALPVVRAIGVNFAALALERYLDSKTDPRFPGTPADFAANYALWTKKPPSGPIMHTAAELRARELKEAGLA